MTYSGRTTCLRHKSAEKHAKDAGVSLADWLAENAGEGENAFQTKVVFEAQWTNCPIEVEAEVRRLWDEQELGNDNYYYSWSNRDDQIQDYPIIARYLQENGVQECLINWWW